MNDVVLQAEELTRTFGETRAVDGLSLEVGAGEVFGFLGHNGAGKTTSVRLFNGVLAPSSGTMRVLGFDPVTQGTQIRARSGVLTESPALDDRLTARATLQLYGEMFGVPKAYRRKRADDLLELFDLGARANDKVGGFSKGMKQRMALARTIIHQPDIIFLDEPTAALDPVATRDVHQMIRNASQKGGRTVILCTHNLYEAERLCTRVAVMAKGKILAQGTPLELSAQYGSAQRILIEVDPSQIEGAMERVRTLPAAPHVERSESLSNGFTVQGIPAIEIPLILNALVSVGVRVYQVVREQATLEDVYFALQGKENGDG